MPVRSCVGAWRTFLGIGSLFFSNFLHEVRGSYMLKSDEARFFGNNPISEFWAKKGSRKVFFLILKKIGSLLFAINGGKWKHIMSFKYLRKPHVREKSGSQDMGQNPQSGRGSWAATNNIPIPYGKSDVANFYLIV